VETVLPEQRLLRKARLWHLENDRALSALQFLLFLSKQSTSWTFLIHSMGMVKSSSPGLLVERLMNRDSSFKFLSVTFIDVALRWVVVSSELGEKTVF
jgi:hypothetical protein